MSAFIDGEASQDEARRAREHLAGCISCRLTVAQWRDISARLPVEAPVSAAGMVARIRSHRRRRKLGLLAAAVLLSVLASGTIVRTAAVQPPAQPPGRAQTAGSLSSSPGVPTVAPSEQTRPRGEGRPGVAASPLHPLPGLFPCADNGARRATDVGVTTKAIQLATTIARSGPMAATFGDAMYGIEAAANAINRAGGVCGRRLAITYRDDGGSPTLGSRYLHALAKDVFAIPVEPNPDAINAFIRSGAADKYGTPIVGTLGTVQAESSSRWVWPVGSSSATFGRIAAIDADRTGAHSFGTVFQKDWKSQVEGAKAFDAQVVRLTGHHIDGYNEKGDCTRRYCGILSGHSYTFDAHEFYGERVDATSLILDQPTALDWMGTLGVESASARRYDAWPGLFSNDFASQCGSQCAGMRVWMPFIPATESGNDAVALYRGRLRTVNPSVDPTNYLVESAYIGTMLLADAMARTGVNLTRERLRRVLDGQTFETGLTRPLTYGTYHTGNRCLRAYLIDYEGAAFHGWKRTGDWVCDPTP